MSRERGEGEYSGKEAIFKRLESDGHDPAGFIFYFLRDQSADGKLDSCRFEELPEELESFCCQGKDGWPLYNYDRHKRPDILKMEQPEPRDP